jgi:hypothetical protein
MQGKANTTRTQTSAAGKQPSHLQGKTTTTSS